MLTDLSFLQAGGVWPPASEASRINKYTNNRLLFEAEHSTVFAQSWKRVIRTRTAMTDDLPTSYDMVINYPKLVSVATAGLLFNKAPGVVAGEESDAVSMQVVNDISERSNLQSILYACAIDVSRYGDGLLYVRRGEDGKGIIDITRPDVWFPIMDSRNIRRVQYHVLATPYSIDRPNSMGGAEQDWYLQVEIHGRGTNEIRQYKLTGSISNGYAYYMIGTMLSSRKEQTGLTDFAIIPIHNLLTSDRAYGIDDYADIKSMVCEVEVRMEQISKILDKHSDPSMQGPDDALDVYIDEITGKTVREFIPGQYFVNKSGGEQGPISYLTWDAQLEANFKYIDKLIEFIRTTSEMGALLSDMSEKGGAIPSGAAMRRMLYSAIGKVNRIRNSFSPALQKAFLLASELSGGNLDNKPIYIKWPDALPRDPLEEAQVANTRTGGGQTQSIKRAIMQLDDLSEEEAEAELEAIQDDKAASMAGVLERTVMTETPDKEPEADDEGV